jgi:hypothetical protein
MLSWEIFLATMNCLAVSFFLFPYLNRMLTCLGVLSVFMADSALTESEQMDVQLLVMYVRRNGAILPSGSKGPTELSKY